MRLNKVFMNTEEDVRYSEKFINHSAELETIVHLNLKNILDV